MNNKKPLLFRNECSQNCCYKHKLATGLNYFQLVLDEAISSLQDITDVELRNVSDNEIVDDTDISFSLYSDTSSIKYLSIILNAGNELIGSEYYLSVETTEGFYYSEPFCISQISKKMITIEWSGGKKVGKMIYPPNFKHSVNIDAIISVAESELEQEVDEDGFGNEVPNLQILKQRMAVSFLVPNFIAQSLTALPLHSKVNFINRYIGETPTELKKENLNITVIATPEADNCFSFIEINYDQNTTIKSGCDEMIINLAILEGTELVWSDTETSEERTSGIYPYYASFEIIDFETEGLQSIGFYRKVEADEGANEEFELLNSGGPDFTFYNHIEYSSSNAIFFRAQLNYIGNTITTNLLKLTLT